MDPQVAQMDVPSQSRMDAVVPEEAARPEGTTQQVWQKKVPTSETQRCLKFVKRCSTRASELSFELLRKCRHLDAEDAHYIAHSIDSFENYEQPERLRVDLVDDENLVVVYGGSKPRGQSQWRTKFYSRNGMEAASLHRAVLIQIMSQKKEFFLSRKLIRDVAAKHFGVILGLKDGVKIASGSDLPEKLIGVTQIPLAAEEVRKELVHRFEDFFNDLAQKNVDVEGVLLDSWKPLNLQCAMWAYAYLLRRATGKDPAQCAENISQQEQVGNMVTLWDLARTLTPDASWSAESNWTMIET